MRLRDPKQFNDPFELSPRFPPDASIIEEFSRFAGPVDPFWHGHAAEAARFALMQSFGQRGRLLCCSKSPENILMWSHYGEQHRGLVLEIETDIFCDERLFFSEILKVDYELDRPLATALFDDTTEAFARDARKSLKTKAEFWSYEQEFRVLIPIFDGMRIVDGHYELPFEPGAIKSVTLGCASHLASEHQFEESIKEVLEQPAYNHLERRKAYIHRDEFKLVFEALNL